MPRSDTLTMPSLRALYAWSLAQPPERLSQPTARGCPLAQYWRDQGRDIVVPGDRTVRTLNYAGTWTLPARLQAFATTHDYVVDREQRELTPHDVRRVIETLERDAMLLALEEPTDVSP